MKFLFELIVAFSFIHQGPAQSTCPACTYDEICDTNSRTCQCNPDLYFNLTVLESILKLTPLMCQSQQILLQFSSCLARTLNMSEFTIPESFPCFYYYGSSPAKLGEALLAFNFSSVNPTCSYDLSVNDTFATYSFHAFFIYNSTDKAVAPKSNITVNYSCSYPLDMQASLNQAVKPILRIIYINVAGTGTFKIIMALFRNADFTDPYVEADMPIPWEVGQPMYIGAFVDGADPKMFSLKIKSCYATPINDSDSSIKYHIIKDGCPVLGSAHATVVENGVSLNSKFVTRAFKFTSSDQIFLFFSATLCRGTCTPVCNGKKKRSIESAAKIVGFGPFLVNSTSFSVSACALVWKVWLLLSFLAFKAL